jgi:hypothetical protein
MAFFRGVCFGDFLAWTFEQCDAHTPPKAPHTRHQGYHHCHKVAFVVVLGHSRLVQATGSEKGAVASGTEVELGEGSAVQGGWQGPGDYTNQPSPCQQPLPSQKPQRKGSGGGERSECSQEPSIL